MLQNNPNTVPLLSNKTSMTKEIKKNDETPAEGEEVATPATTETPEAPVVVEGDTSASEANAVNADVNDVEVLKNTIAEMEKNHASALETLKNEYEAKLQTETNKIREEERANLAKVVAETNASTGNVKTTDDLRKKYFKK